MKEFLRFFLKRGSIIGSSRDTGYLLYQNYSSRVKSECMQAVFNESVKVRPVFIRSKWNVFIEKLLPERYSYLPKKKDYYSEKSFKDLGYPDTLSRGWDEFLWQGKPFGFHLQGARKDGAIADHADDMIYLQKVLREFLRK